MKLATLAALSFAAASASAQKSKEPRRPKLPAGSDTNDARVYYNFATAALSKSPDQAADALYWAARLEPSSAEAFYARRIALLLDDKRRLIKYWSGDKRTIQSDEVKRIDSLYYHALTLNPLISQRLERALFDAVLDEIASEVERSGGGSSGEARYAIDRYLMQAPAATRAWSAYAEGRFDDALDLYTRAVKDAKTNPSIRVERARLQAQMNRPDSALGDFTVAVEEMRKKDKKDLVYVYDSKALLEHSIAVLHQRVGHTDLAREALGRALQEDLAYYPAHVQLGYIALDQKDTTTALNEMDLAVQLRGDDELLRFVYGYALAATGKVKDAETQLRKAIELNPVYAAPHLTLGQVLEATGRASDAVAEYRLFIARAAASDLRRQDAEKRLAALVAKGSNP